MWTERRANGYLLPHRLGGHQPRHCQSQSRAWPGGVFGVFGISNISHRPGSPHRGNGGPAKHLQLPPPWLHNPPVGCCRQDCPQQVDGISNKHRVQVFKNNCWKFRLDCSKLIPCSESLKTINIDDQFSPGRCQVGFIQSKEWPSFCLCFYLSDFKNHFPGFYPRSGWQPALYWNLLGMSRCCGDFWPETCHRV